MKQQPPEHSFVDNNGWRFVFLDIDIMVQDGDRFFTTFRYKAPVSYDFVIGRWWIDADGLSDALYAKYPSLQKREDVRILLNKAKTVKTA